MSETPDLLSALRDFLIVEGLVRDPDVPGTGDPTTWKPPLWLDPRLGPPAPGEGDAPQKGHSITVSALTAPGVPSERFEQIYHRTDGVDLRIRSLKAPDAKKLEQTLRRRLADRRDWQLGDPAKPTRIVRVIESLEFRPLQLLSSGEQGFDYVSGYLFQTYVNQPT